MREEDSAVIRPTRGRNEPRIDADALMVMGPETLRLIVRKTGAREAPGSREHAFHRLYVWSPAAGRAIALAGPYLGAPHAVLGLEKLIALGAEKIWVLGTCGSLSPAVRIGDAVIPTHALSEEGTSRHYPGGGSPPRSDPFMIQRLREALLDAGVPYHEGEVWTTDAPFRETRSKVAAYGSRGILAVEMEWSALIAVASYRGAALAGLLVVSDELFELKWKPGFRDPSLTRGLETAGEILLRLAAGGEGCEEPSVSSRPCDAPGSETPDRARAAVSKEPT
ncbi:MAG: nucleoside phosphorylase [Deltaproteobacteria bacterium]|nr:nucleoside phosphorylase [Deltaproteobacteria bacterium]MBW1924459.1 nucleoside phosphorylase [Deltaproteobacteria bacterium]MBW1951133.1 nucleoside phosphorylase [Deltaproteobacteria bacterium]MBW2008736.1 nucleoside phosphorylase [Deltaproteobacteria bacterium]